MDVLYHGSGFKHDELKPGIMHSGKLVKWDKTESNEWLYATTVKEEAIRLGFASSVEKKYPLDRFNWDGKTLLMTFSGHKPTVTQLSDLDLFLYTIHWDKDIWKKVNNQHNNIDTEYKTKSIIRPNAIELREQIDIALWLSQITLNLRFNSVALNW